MTLTRDPKIMTTSAKPQSSVPCTLFVMNDINPVIESEFNEWYQTEHVRQRMQIPGFLSARRYRALGDSQAYMAIYSCTEAAVLEQQAYKDILVEPTPLTKKMMPHFRNMVRSVCDETWSAGTGLGGEVVVLRCAPKLGQEHVAREFIAQTLYPKFAGANCLVRMALWEASGSVGAAPSPEEARRGAPDQRVNWVLFFEAYDLATCENLLQQPAMQRALEQHGIITEAQASYRLISTFEAEVE
jgi:hypothetical protein